MNIAEGLLAEFEQELKTTRRCIERIPADKLDWRPHGKSMTLGQLALHLANTQSQVMDFMLQDELEFQSINRSIPEPANHAEILASLDRTAAKVRQLLPTIDDTRMMQTWRLVDGDKELFAIPRAIFIRAIMFNHVYHHRGQLTVYLRMLDIPVPAVYGDSADEPPLFMQNAAQ